MIIDGFLDTFDELIGSLKSAEFNDLVNPVDGVTYPHISEDIPDNVRDEILSRIEDVLSRSIDNYLMFMRRSPAGVNAPHAAHSDASMGDYSLMLYLNEHPGSGTSMVVHKKTGIAYNPELAEFVDIIVRDQNIDDEWEVTDMIEMKKNRAFIFRSDALHRAEPVGGVGEEKEARTVLTCFFS